MIHVLTIFSVLFAAAVMGYYGTRQAVRETVQSDAARAPQRAIPRRWSTPLIVMAVVYCFLLLAGLSWAGWFRVA
jgi:hypothetical protein